MIVKNVAFMKRAVIYNNEGEIIENELLKCYDYDSYSLEDDFIFSGRVDYKEKDYYVYSNVGSDGKLLNIVLSKEEENILKSNSKYHVNRKVCKVFFRGSKCVRIICKNPFESSLNEYVDVKGVVKYGENLINRNFYYKDSSDNVYIDSNFEFRLFGAYKDIMEDEEVLFKNDKFLFRFKYFYFKSFNIIAKMVGSVDKIGLEELKVKGITNNNYNSMSTPCLRVDNFDESVIDLIMYDLKMFNYIKKETVDIMEEHVRENGNRILRIV